MSETPYQGYDNQRIVEIDRRVTALEAAFAAATFNPNCVCGGSLDRPNDDCERCRMQAALAAATKRAEDLQATADQWKSEAERLRQLGVRQQQEIETLGEMADAVERLREIGRATGCDHVDDPDGRTRLVRCVEEVIGAAEQRATEAERITQGCRDLIATQRTRIAAAERENARLREFYDKVPDFRRSIRDVIAEIGDQDASGVRPHTHVDFEEQIGGLQVLDYELAALLAKPEGAK